MMPKTVKKVLAYVTDGDMLLVFRHRDFPEAGLQVPAGTVEQNEDPETAVLRELREESGLTEVRIVRLAGYYVHDARPHRDELHERHVFHIEPTSPQKRSWTHHEDHASDGSGPITFEFFWMKLGDPGLTLSGDQGELLGDLRRTNRT